MTMEQARALRAGDTIRHNGVWAYRIGSPACYEVLSTDAICIRVRRDGRGISRYEWDGCSTFVTRDFFASCTVEF